MQDIYKSIPIESPYVKVQTTPVDGLTVYGEKYYQAGDLVTLRCEVDNNLDNLKILVNNDVACYSSATVTYEYTAIANELADGVKIEIQPEAEISIDGFQISTKGHVKTAGKFNNQLIHIQLRQSPSHMRHQSYVHHF